MISENPATRMIMTGGKPIGFTRNRTDRRLGGASTSGPLGAQPEMVREAFETIASASDYLFISSQGQVTRRDSGLEARVFLWVCEHPGIDAEAVGDRFGISTMEASDIIERLLNRGLLDFGT